MLSALFSSRFNSASSTRTLRTVIQWALSLWSNLFSKRFRNTFFESYSGIATWHHTLKVGASRETRTLTGRRRAWTETPKITALYNTPVQGTAADITKKALGLLPKRLADTGAEIIGTVHDEIIREVPEKMADYAAAILRETMIKAGEAYLSRVPVEVEVTIADTRAEK